MTVSIGRKLIGNAAGALWTDAHLVIF